MGTALPQPPLTPLYPADSQEYREGTKGRNGPAPPLATYPQQRVPAVTVGEGICVLSPRLQEQGRQLEQSSWKEAGGPSRRGQPRMGQVQCGGTKQVAPSPKRVSRSGATQLTLRTSPGQWKGSWTVRSGEKEFEGRKSQEMQKLKRRSARQGEAGLGWGDEPGCPALGR